MSEQHHDHECVACCTACLTKELRYLQNWMENPTSHADHADPRWIPVTNAIRATRTDQEFHFLHTGFVLGLEQALKSLAIRRYDQCLNPRNDDASTLHH